MYPAAGLIDYYKGKKLVLVNKTATPMDGRADLVINERIGEVVPALFGFIENGEDKLMYQAEESRYDKMNYKRCGNSGILLPRVSLGMWQNFGAEKPLPEQKEIIFRALIWELPISIWQTTMAHPILEWQKKILEKFLQKISSSTGSSFWFRLRPDMISGRAHMVTGDPENI